MPQVLAPLDFEMAQIVHQELNRNGVKLVLNDGLLKFTDNGRKIHLESGKVIETDMIIFAIGVSPESGLAKSAGLLIGPRGHIVTSPKLETFDAQTQTHPNGD